MDDVICCSLKVDEEYACDCVIAHCAMNMFHVTAKPQVVYRTMLWIVNYKITVKSALSLKRGHPRQICELKIKKNWRKTCW